jgi:lactate permease
LSEELWKQGIRILADRTSILGAVSRRTLCEASVTWTQNYDPLGNWWLSTLLASLPILVLLGLLAGLRVRPHICAIAGAATAVLCAIIVFKMPAQLALASFGYGVAFGLLKIIWIVVAAVFLYEISVATGQFEIMKESVAAITPDRRLQLLLVAFCFGSFIEGSAGFGAPVAIAGAFMIGLGFRPFQAAVLNLIANTAPVAWGAIGTPVHTLALVSGLSDGDLNKMIGRILPFTAVIVPFWLVRTMVSWSETLEVLPAILVVGISFAGMQYFWSNHVDSNLVDIAAGIFSLLATLVFLRVWRPKRIAGFGRGRKRSLKSGHGRRVASGRRSSRRTTYALHGRTNRAGVDAVCNPFGPCFVLGFAFDQSSDGEGDHAGICKRWVERPLPAQDRAASATGSGQVDTGKCQV